MERLTERDKFGDLYVKEHDYISASKKLAEYEDTGLTPDQILQLKKECDELEKQNEEMQNCNIEYYNRAKDAEKENACLKRLLEPALREIERLDKLEIYE